MLSIPYDATRESLFHPGNADDFFTHGPISSDAALCAEMARLAYVKETSRLAQYLARADFDLVKPIGYESSGTQLFCAKSRGAAKSAAVVAFRGTEPDDPSDLFTDAKFAMTRWMVDGKVFGKVHVGFDASFRSVFSTDQSLRELIPIGVDRVLFTGHSLGAALATLASSVLPSGHLYTFGSPLVGDEEFRRSMHDVDHSRYVDCCDLVTRVPPEFLGYAHVGGLRHIDRNGDVLSAPSNEAIEQDRREAARAYLFKYALRRGTVAVRELADHTPINYVSGVMGLRARDG